MNVNVVWDGGLKFVGTSETGRQMLMDAPAAAGGEGKGPQPTETLLMAVGGCTGNQCRQNP